MEKKINVEIINSFITKVKEEYETDSKWSLFNLSEYVQTLAYIISKYLNYWYKIKYWKEQMEKEYNDLWIDVFMSYKQDSDLKLSTSDVKMLVDRDRRLGEKKEILSLLSHAGEYIEKCIDNLKGSRYDTRVLVDYEKFKAGV